jgi:FkbM family methyltransferase
VSSSGIELGVARIDYDKAKLLIEVNSDIEARFRAHCVEKEPFTVDFIERIPKGGVLYDIGANVGSYSLIALSRGVPTIAIEPGSENYAALCRNIRMNNLMELAMPICVALADDIGTTWLDYSDLRAGAASHNLGSARKLHLHRQRVPVFTLDGLIADFKLPRPTHIKIDTDGNELAVLKGMAGVLASEQLQGLMIEMPNAIEDQIMAAMDGYDWQMTARFDHRNGVKIEQVAYAEFGRKVASAPELALAGAPAIVVPNGTVAA